MNPKKNEGQSIKVHLIRIQNRVSLSLIVLIMVSGILFVNNSSNQKTSTNILMVNAQTVPSVTVTFDNPAPTGSPDSLLNGVFQGIDFGSGQWRWSGPYASDPSNNLYFSSNVNSRSFTFSPAPKILKSMLIYTTVTGTITLTDNLGQTKTQSITSGSMQLVTTNWAQGSNVVTVAFTAGWASGIDNITYADAGSDTTLPNISITSPVSGTNVTGTISVLATASDNIGVVGVQFKLDGVNLGVEDTTSPYSITWDTTNTSNGFHTLTAVARDAAGNSRTSSGVVVNVNNNLPSGAGYALRFFGNGVNDIDRVKIQVDDSTNSNPGPPADVGAEDFTLEFWMKANPAENPAPAVSCGANINWIYGNIVFDRDRFNQDRKYGISIAGGVPVFGVSGDGTGSLTICGATNVLNGQWHHVVALRRRADGWMWLFVDGILQAQADGPDGDISYPDNGVPGNFCGPLSNQPCTNSDPYLVIAAEKHDAGSQYPSFSGWVDETRFSRVLRYMANFIIPNSPFVTDANTAALYHFDEGSGDIITDTSGAIGGPSNGIRKFGGNPLGPQWVISDAPLSGIPLNDTIPPSTPTGITAIVISSSQINLNWNAASDNVGVTGYRIFRNGTQIATTSATSYSNTGLAPSTTYSYRVAAYDAAGNVGLQSSPAIATTSASSASTTVTFDNPSPPGSPDSLLNGIFQGIDFGSGQWRWSGPYAADTTNSAYFSSAVSSRSFTFSPAPKILNSIRVYTVTSGTITLTDNLGQTKTQSIIPGSMQLVTTNWAQGSSVVTIAFTAGWALGIDDISYS